MKLASQVIEDHGLRDDHELGVRRRRAVSRLDVEPAVVYDIVSAISDRASGKDLPIEVFRADARYVGDDRL